MREPSTNRFNLRKRSKSLLLLLSAIGGLLLSGLSDGDVEADNLGVLSVLGTLLEVPRLGVGHGESAVSSGLASSGHVDLVHLGLLITFAELLLVLLFLLVALLGLLVTLSGDLLHGRAFEELNGKDIIAVLVEDPGEALLAGITNLPELGLANGELSAILSDSLENLGVVEVHGVFDLSLLLLSHLFVATSEHEVQNNTHNKDACDDDDKNPRLHVFCCF